MATSSKNPGVDAYFSEAERWRKELEELRKIVLASGLTEELKWGKPCYTFQGSNVVIMIGFKEYCALQFCKGVLLKDAAGILVRAGENTQAACQARFTGVPEIAAVKSVLKAYILEAIDLEKAGVKVQYKKSSEFAIPDELRDKLDESPELKTAFGALTPGRQRGYILFFSAPRQSKTRNARIGKCAQRILDGKGLNDR